MDAKIIDTLVKFGLITNIGVNADAYDSIDDLINKGVVTIPGAKDKIQELLKSIEPEQEEHEIEIETKIEPIKIIEQTIIEPVEKQDEITIIVEDKESETIVEDKSIKSNKSKKQTNKIEE